MSSNNRRVKHRQMTESEMRRYDGDTRFVAFISDAHKWDRKPGDRLTLMQRIHVVGGAVVVILALGFIAFEGYHLFQIAIELRQPDYGQP